MVPQVLQVTMEEKVAVIYKLLRVRAYHIYEDVWVEAIGEELVSQREQGNSHGSHAVALPGCCCQATLAGILADSSMVGITILFVQSTLFLPP